MREIDSLAQRVNELNGKVDFWNHWMLVGLVLAAIAALWLAITTRLGIVRSKQLSIAQGLLESAKDRLYEADSKEKDARIADANEAAKQAEERAANAQASLASAEEQAAEANERAASLEVQALTLRKELLLQGARENLLSGDNRRKLVRALKAFAGQRVDVRYSANAIEVNGAVVTSTPIGDDTVGLANALVSVLKDAGWSLPPAPLLYAVQGYGINVEIVASASPETQQAARALADALRDASLEVFGPQIVSPDRAERVGTGAKALLPALDQNTIVLGVLTHPK